MLFLEFEKSTPKLDSLWVDRATKGRFWWRWQVDIALCVDRYGLNDRIEFLGTIQHSNVRGVLCRGHIFLNPSLIEAFWIALLEAASCGLLVVSTNVGGIPEVLPPDMLYLANPDEHSVQQQLEKAINDVGLVSTETYHEKIKELYSWQKTAAQTEVVYDNIMKTKHHCLTDRFKIWLSSGYINGFFLCMLVIVFIVVAWVCEYFVPAVDIDEAVNFPVKRYKANKHKYGDHLFIVDNRPNNPLIKKYGSK
jgi:phosphatidylinositol N-acetylglucosaminyltransferase subunit A